MPYKFPNVKMKDGLFGPTLLNDYYQPVAYHNKSATVKKHKTKWILKQNEQYEVFRLSNEGVWLCKNNNGLFSILENGDMVMGDNEERLSFFPNPVNDTDPYHGYPVSSSEYELSVELVDKWLENKIITNRIHIKLLKGQI